MGLKGLIGVAFESSEPLGLMGVSAPSPHRVYQLSDSGFVNQKWTHPCMERFDK